jgi:hypothetical protein
MCPDAYRHDHERADDASCVLKEQSSELRSSMIDSSAGATAFATIVQLLAIYRQERGARKDLDHRDFIEWLEHHRHEEIKELITNTYHLQSQVDDLLRQDRAVILHKLDEVNRIAASILARLDGFSTVADIVVPNLGLSLQTMGLLRLLARSKTGRFIMISEDQFAVNTAFFHLADAKFFHDDVTALIAANLVTVDHTSAGELILRLNRRGAQLASMFPPPSEEEPNFVLPE